MVKQVKKLQRQKELGEGGFAPGAIPGTPQPATPANSVAAAGNERGGTIFTYTMGPMKNPVGVWDKGCITNPMFMEDGELIGELFKNLQDLMEVEENAQRFDVLSRKTTEAAKDTRGNRVTNQRPSIPLPSTGLKDLLKALAPPKHIDLPSVPGEDKDAAEVAKTNLQQFAAWGMTPRAKRVGSETGELASIRAVVSGAVRVGLAPASQIMQDHGCYSTASDKTW